FFALFALFASLFTIPSQDYLHRWKYFPDCLLRNGQYFPSALADGRPHLLHLFLKDHKFVGHFLQEAQ
ncbi:MAG: hypothetical protein ACREAM_04390, partial [Blastocatellia bacterium]